jgi:hypothetical protein
MSPKTIWKITKLRSVFLLLLICLCLAAGCDTGMTGQTTPLTQANNSGNPKQDGMSFGQPATEPLGPFPIATPSQVSAKLRGVKQASSLLTRDASDFVPGFSQRVNPTAPELIYSPQWVDGHSALDTVSYAIYRFDLTACLGRPVINTQWSHAPGDSKLLWLGASNWQKDRWDWYAGSSSGSVRTKANSMELYKHAETSEMYVVVVILGQSSARLQEIWLTGFSMRGDWWMQGRDAALRYCSPFIGPDSPALLWQQRLDQTRGANPPVYDVNGVLYMPVYPSGHMDGSLFALNPDGSRKWVTALPVVDGGAGGFSGSYSVAIGDDGTIYCAVVQGPLCALSQTGDIMWSYAGHLNVIGHPSIAADGSIYVCGLDYVIDHYEYYLYSLKADGSLRWEYGFGARNEASSPAIGADGTAYVGLDDTVYAITKSGGLAWVHMVSAGVRLGDPSIGPDGRVDVVSSEPKLYVLNADGSLAGVHTFTQGISRQFALDPAGGLYASPDQCAYALNSDYTQRWSYFMPSGGFPIVDAAGNVYVAGVDSRLYAIGPDGMLKWWFVASDAFDTAPILGEDGTLYAVDREGMMYAIGPGSQSQVEEHALSGYVKDGLGQGLAGVLVTVTGEEPVATDADGYWRKAGLADGTYLVSPTLTGYEFNPLFEEGVISGGDATMADFTGAPLAPPAWPMYGLNRAHTRCSPYAGPDTPELRWTVALPGQNINMEPAIGGDGTLYVQCKTGLLAAISMDGILRWSEDLGFASPATPALAADGAVITVTDNGLVHAFTPGGIFMWTASKTSSASALITDTNTLLMNTGFYISAMDFFGAAIWDYRIYDVGPVVNVAPGIAADGTIYVPTYNLMGAEYRNLAALNPDGTLKWVTPVDPGPCSPSSSPAVGADGTVYLGFGKYFYAFSPAGTQLWSHYTSDADGDNIYQSPAIASDGTIYYVRKGSTIPENNKLVALNPDGSLKWEFYAGGQWFSTCPTVDANGVVYTGIVGTGEIHAINPDGTLKWTYVAATRPGSISIGPDGTLYFGDNTGSVYALGAGGG